MERRTLLIAGIALAIVGVVGLVVTSLVGSILPDGPVGRRRTVDAMFIEQMVPHHQDAIDMADIATTRAEHPEIRELARRIKRSQTAENRQMRTWYRQWYGAPVPDVADGGMMGGPMMGTPTDLERLRSADEFDREFIEQMVPHHRMAIMMARMAGSSTNRPEMRLLTESIAQNQAQEVVDMLRWHRRWYGD